LGVFHPADATWSNSGEGGFLDINFVAVDPEVTGAEAAILLGTQAENRVWAGRGHELT
jgi:hypothetical protein